MSKTSPALDQFCECTNRFGRTKMKKSITQKMGGGETGFQMAEAITWTCPACGYSKSVVDTHGTGITRADMNGLLS